MIHENLKKIRLAKGMTQLHLAKKLGISNMAYSRMESGKTKIDAEILKVLSKELDVRVEVFFTNELTESVIIELAIDEVV
ncbi:helix-turn-helix domain-containing protein [Sporosarcina psychrophila]|uniref:Transcriptional regulator with XRE-family HTH domain n=1 Tax=Sporosarcina psychrophila TaxID=1476 RepID=A0ABV2KB71_SPOPS